MINFGCANKHKKKYLLKLQFSQTFPQFVQEQNRIIRYKLMKLKKTLKNKLKAFYGIWQYKL